jgi:hypothetical protein
MDFQDFLDRINTDGKSPKEKMEYYLEQQDKIKNEKDRINDQMQFVQGDNSNYNEVSRAIEMARLAKQHIDAEDKERNAFFKSIR